MIALWTIGGILTLAPVAQMQTSTQVNEGFEAGGKTSYAAANVTFTSGSWNLNDALTGNLTSDVKTGNYAVRVRNSGIVSMNFNAGSAGVVSLSHARYGSDGSSSWELWESTDSGSSWTRVGAAQTTASSSQQTAAFTVNYPGAVRLQLRKTAGEPTGLILIILKSRLSRPQHRLRLRPERLRPLRRRPALRLRLPLPPRAFT